MASFDLGYEILTEVADASAARKRLMNESHADWLIEELERLGAKVDVVLPGEGVHRYWSTHCRHASGPDDPIHSRCSAAWMKGQDGFRSVSMERLPAQCKTCAAPCICSCHDNSKDS